MLIAIAITLHLLGALVWVGGMFFAYLALRPAAASVLEPPLRLPLWEATFQRFFFWVWIAIALLLVTGYWLVLGPYGGFAEVRPFIHIMNAIGLLMMAIYGHLYFVPYKRMRRAIAVQDWPEAGRNLNQIRIIVAVNLILGLITVVVAVAGRYLG